MHPFSILMFIFSGALLLYALLLGLTKSVELIPRSHMVSIKNKRVYAATVAKMLAIAALAPMSSGFYGLFSLKLGGIALIVGLPLSLWIGYRLFGGDLQ